MDPLTRILKNVYAHRVLAIEKYATEYESIQRNTLTRLLKQAASTEWGRRYGFATIRDYADYARTVPICRYEDIRDDMVRIMNGARDVIWPGQIENIALSSGTTSDRSKFVPVSTQSLRHSHIQGGFDVFATYVDSNPDSRVTLGYQMSLSGKFRTEYKTPYVRAGEVSAIMTASIPPFVRNMMRFIPPQRLALIDDYHEKFDTIACYVAKRPLATIIGLPSWILTVLNLVVEHTGKENLSEVWPSMELFVHGGVGFAPYKPVFERLFPHGLHYRETYNASEGFFGIQTDANDPAMMLMLDYDNFFEFIPLSVYGTPQEYAIPLWETQVGVDYALVLTTASGLWRYDLSDVVHFTSRAPYKILISGRTTQTLESCGETLSVAQAERALHTACQRTGCTVKEYTVSPLFAEDGRGRHQWLIEFVGRQPDAVDFASTLDGALQEQCELYHSKRSYDSPLMMPTVTLARYGLFDAWMKARGKYGGQNKVPRLSMDRKHIDQLLAMNAPLQ